MYSLKGFIHTVGEMKKENMLWFVVNRDYYTPMRSNDNAFVF